MKKINVKMITAFIVVVALICLVSNVNYATGDINELLQNIVEIPEEPAPVVEQTPEPAPATTNTVPTAQNKANTVLPKTGVDDTAMWALIVVSAVAAIYTYKKVKDYNV